MSARRVFRGVLLLLYLGLIAASARYQQEQPVNLTLERTSEAAGAVTLEATLKNVSKTDVTIGVGDPVMDYKLTVEDGHGVSVPLSKYGREVFSKDRVRWTKYIMVTLGPGENHVDTWSIDNLFEFARPGRYSVSVSRQFRVANATQPQSVSSNVLQIVLDAK